MSDNNLTKIGDSIYGTKYAFKGCFPLNYPDVSELKWGDTIHDNNGKGMSLCVNTCWTCKKNFLYSMIIFAEVECTKCERDALLKPRFNYDEDY